MGKISGFINNLIVVLYLYLLSSLQGEFRINNTLTIAEHSPTPNIQTPKSTFF